jgi:hypothetical protein
VSFRVPNQHRVHEGPLGSLDSYGNNGMFKFSSPVPGRVVRAFASDGEGWEHVSVSVLDGQRVRTPIWDEMCRVKLLFWDEEDTVVQFHPRKSDYVNVHPNVLHLWRKIGSEFELPPHVLVGPKTAQEMVEAKKNWGLEAGSS